MSKISRRLLHLYWKLFGYPDCPPRVLNRSSLTSEYTGYQYTPRYLAMYIEYVQGHDVGVIAERYNVTRTRVRHCLWKAYRQQ